MRAVNPCFIRQLHDLLQGSPHLCGRAFEEPAAAHGEQRVADEGGAVGLEQVADMRPRMAGCFDDARRVFAECEAIAFPNHSVETGNPVGIGAGADDLAAGAGLEGEIAAGVIGVMVGVEDVVEYPAAFSERTRDGLGVRAVYGCSESRVRIVHQVSIVVPEAGDR